jgi:hypothetical protein
MSKLNRLQEPTMPTEPGFALGAQEQGLFAWTRRWCEHAAAQGFIALPYQPEPPMLKRLIDYFRAGIDVDDAVNACFGQKH